jgi:hypothetical protein
MKRLFPIFALLLAMAPAGAQIKEAHPGAQPDTPTRIDWLTTTLQAALRQDLTVENGFSLDIAEPDSETVLIYVRYLPNVDRTIMNMTIDTARKVIQTTAQSYGWDGWVKIKEDVEMGKHH